MDGVRIQAKVDYGRGKAASIVGLPFDQYRVTDGGATAAIASGNNVGSIDAWFTIVSTTGADLRAPKVKDFMYDALVDGSAVNVGDILVNATAGTFFISAKMPLIPTKAIRCTDTVSIVRSVSASQYGNIGYSGVGVETQPGADTETTIAAGVPCAIQTDGYGRATPTGILPADAPGPTKWIVYLPSFVTEGSVIDSDVAVDQIGNRYQVAAASWTGFHYMLEMIRLEA